MPRTGASAQKGNEVDTGRFVLLEDIEHLERQITGLDRSAISSVEIELRGKLRDSEKMAQQMEAWAQRYDGRIWHANSERFVQFMQGLKKRWGWDFNGKPKVTGKRKFDQLLRWVEEAPELNQDVWDRAEKVLRGLMADAELSKPATTRPWSLKATPEAGPSLIPI
ncbi:hypothetical protein FRB90_007406 [Tulasnella sp. 427]|nr:hypothetical protein FRB90_007406 [Tulasnella sp. 427]